MTVISRFFLVSLLFSWFLHGHAAAADTGGFVVFELFTSEGCSSCPPADAVLAKLGEDAQKYDQPVYCLSFHIDYWNKLGWKDPFADPAFTRRQLEYTKVFGLRDYYVPQMVVNGSEQFLGSSRTQAEKALKQYLAVKALATVKLKATAAKGSQEITVEYTLTGAPAGAQLCVVWVENEVFSGPDHGENRGKRLRHINVVRNFQTIELRSSLSGKLGLSRGEVKSGKIIAFVQIPQSGRILGAASAEVTEPAAKSQRR